MFIFKCEICQKDIKNYDRDMVAAGIGWDKKELCIDCGRPIINFLLLKELITKEQARMKYS